MHPTGNEDWWIVSPWDTSLPLHSISSLSVPFSTVTLLFWRPPCVQWTWWPCSITSGSRSRRVSWLVPSVNQWVPVGTQPSRRRACCCMNLHRPPVHRTSATSPFLEEAALGTTRCVGNHQCFLETFFLQLVNVTCMCCHKKHTCTLVIHKLLLTKNKVWWFIPVYVNNLYGNCFNLSTSYWK